MPDKKPFEKPALSLEKQLSLLQERGLIITDPKEAENFLRYVGYYHFSAYALSFQKADKTDNHHYFHTETNFSYIQELYTFDRKLRLLVIDALERIEVALKAAIINHMSLSYDPHWYMDKTYFDPSFKHENMITTIQKNIQYGDPIKNVRDICIRHYYETYDRPAMPPVWMVFEALSFSTISKIYQYLLHADKKEIAQNFRLPPVVLGSWLHSVSYTRNLCAHHQRLWNRVFTITPLLPKDKGLAYVANEIKFNKKFYAQAHILRYFMRVISPESQWSHSLIQLVETYPNISLKKMGFPDDWKAKLER